MYRHDFLVPGLYRTFAELVKLGNIKVVLTTNFDRLLEIALQNVGIHPTVLSGWVTQGSLPRRA